MDGVAYKVVVLALGVADELGTVEGVKGQLEIDLVAPFVQLP